MSYVSCQFCGTLCLANSVVNCTTCICNNSLYIVSTLYIASKAINCKIGITSNDYQVIKNPYPLVGSTVLGGIYYFTYSYENNSTELEFTSMNSKPRERTLLISPGQLVTPSNAKSKLETILTFL